MPASIEMCQQRDLSQILPVLKAQIPRLAEQYQVASLGIFGSYARGDQTDRSDLDILVTFRRTPGLMTLIRLELTLEDLLGVPVDLVTRDSLKPRIGEEILNSLVPV
jgi:uncharacterized protein